jgi:hypothetical protein
VKDRGFKKLIGQKVVAVDARAINCVTLTLQSGEQVEITADDVLSAGLPIPIIELRVVAVAKSEPTTKRAKGRP